MGSTVEFLSCIYIYICKVTNCNPNPKEIGNENGPNKPNTMNL